MANRALILYRILSYLLLVHHPATSSCPAIALASSSCCATYACTSSLCARMMSTAPSSLKLPAWP